MSELFITSILKGCILFHVVMYYNVFNQPHTVGCLDYFYFYAIKTSVMMDILGWGFFGKNASEVHQVWKFEYLWLALCGPLLSRRVARCPHQVQKGGGLMSASSAASMRAELWQEYSQSVPGSAGQWWMTSSLTLGSECLLLETVSDTGSSLGFRIW